MSLVRSTAGAGAGDAYSQSVGLLPPPRVPSSTALKASTVAAIVGDELAAPLVNLEAAVIAAGNAVSELERNRPGPMGTEWKAALQADHEDHAAGRKVAEFRCAGLLKSDPDRWAAAQMAARFVPVAGARCEAELDREEINASAVGVAQGHADAFAGLVAEGWANRARTATAWNLRERAVEALTAFQEANEVAVWAGGGPGVVIDPVAHGQWICLDLVLNPGKRLLSVPVGPVWPEGAEKVLGVAYVPDGVTHRLRTVGHTGEEVPAEGGVVA